MRFFELFHFLNKIGGFLEPAIDAGVADVGDRIDLAEFFHDARADGCGGHLAIEALAEIFDDSFDDGSDGVLGDGTFLARFLHAAGEFLA